MEKDTMIQRDVRLRDITKEHTSDELTEVITGIRTYKSSPTGGCLQLRGVGHLTRHGKRKYVIAWSDYMSVNQLKELQANIQIVIDDIES